MADIFKKKRNVVFIAIFYTFLWGCCFPLVKLCMDGFGIADNMSKCLTAGIRFSTAGLGLIIYSLIKDKKKALPTKEELPYLLGYGLLATALQYAFTYIGLSNVDGAKGAIFDQLCVFIVIILSGLLLKNDKLTPVKALGCAVGFLGILAVNTEKMSFSFALDGELMMTLAAFCQTGSYFVAAACANKVAAVKLVGYGQLLGGIILSAFSLLMGGRITVLSLQGALTLLALALFAAVAYVLSLIPLKYFPASEVSVFNLLITVFGVVMSGLVLGENIFRSNYIISLALIVIGIMLVNKRSKTHEGKNI
jgi:drug/metabolite transporter (DMT)-like permease